MEKLMYMMMIEKSKSYNKMTKQVVKEHVEKSAASLKAIREWQACIS